MKRILISLTFIIFLFIPIVAFAHGGLGKAILHAFISGFIYFLIIPLILGFVEHGIISRKIKNNLNRSSFIGFNYLIIISTGAVIFILYIFFYLDNIFSNDWIVFGISLLALLIISQTLFKFIIYQKSVIKETLSNKNRIFLLTFLLIEVFIVNFSSLIILN